MLVWQIKKIIQNSPVDFNKWPLKRPSAIIGQNRESQKTLNKFLIPGEICNEAVKPPWTRQSAKIFSGNRWIRNENGRLLSFPGTIQDSFCVI